MTIILPTIQQELGDSIPQLFQGLQHLVNPNFDIQQELKKRVAIDPDLRQKLIDQEYLNPGFIEKTFGKQTSYLGQGSPSTTAQSEAFDRVNLNTPISQLSQMGTGASEAAMRKFTGVNSTEYSTQQSQATTAKEQARSAPSVASGNIARGQAEAISAVPLAQEQVAQAEKIKADRATVDAVSKRFKSTKELVDAAATFNPAIKPEELSALYEDKGIGGAIKERNALWSEQYREKALAAREHKQLQSQIEILNRQDAFNIAKDLGGKGFPVSAKDIFTIKSSNLEGTMDSLLADPQKAQAAVAQNPQLGTLLTSWANYSKGMQAEGEDYKTKELNNYQKNVDTFTKEMSSKKTPDEALIQGKLLLLNQQRNQLGKMGTILPELRYGSEGTSWLGKALYAVDANGNKLKDYSQFTQPNIAQGIDLDKMAKYAIDNPSSYSQILRELGDSDELKNLFTKKYLQYKKQVNK